MKKFKENNYVTYDPFAGHILKFQNLNDFGKYILRIVIDTQGRRLRREEFTYIKRKLFASYPELRNDHPQFRPNQVILLSPDWVDDIILDLEIKNDKYEKEVEAIVNSIYFDDPGKKPKSGKKKSVT